jgi:hypothetical protein
MEEISDKLKEFIKKEKENFASAMALVPETRNDVYRDGSNITREFKARAIVALGGKGGTNQREALISMLKDNEALKLGYSSFTLMMMEHCLDVEFINGFN